MSPASDCLHYAVLQGRKDWIRERERKEGQKERMIQRGIIVLSGLFEEVIW